jgi:hypothetical protein
MRKEDVELIILKVSANGQDAINMKIYKNGTTCRSGVGGLPQLSVGLMTFVNDARYFAPLIAKVPQELLDQPINKEETLTPNGYLEYIIAFYGDSKNGDTGERAQWTKSTGVRIKLDQQSNFNHPIMGLLDGLTMEAAELTNELYFDVIMLAKWKAKSSTLPDQTIITQPKTEREIHEDYENYVNQMIGSARKWSMSQYAINKTYEIEGSKTIAKINHDANSFGVRFLPIETESLKNISTNSPMPNDNANKKKPWWKF